MFPKKNKPKNFAASRLILFDRENLSNNAPPYYIYLNIYNI